MIISVILLLLGILGGGTVTYVWGTGEKVRRWKKTVVFILFVAILSWLIINPFDWAGITGTAPWPSGKEWLDSAISVSILLGGMLFVAYICYPILDAAWDYDFCEKLEKLLL